MSYDTASVLANQELHAQWVTTENYEALKQKLADAETENESLANRLDKQVTEFKQKELARLEQRYKENQAHITSSKEAVINDLNSQLDNLRVKYESSQNLYDNVLTTTLSLLSLIE